MNESPKMCIEPGCDRPAQARGLCNAHYHRTRRAYHIDANHLRRARKAGNGGVVAAAEMKTLPDFCVYCFAEEDLSVEHLVPIAKGGRHVIENLTRACLSCNTSKGAKALEEWFAVREEAARWNE